MATAFNADSRAKTRCHIIRNDTNQRFTFQFNPTSIPYSRSATFSSIEAPGMSYPLTQYTGGKAIEFSFDVFYYDRPYSGKINAARRFLKSLLPPEYNTPTFTKPPTFTLAYGYLVKTLVLQDLEVNDEVMDSNGNPTQTRFKLTVRQV